MSDRNIGRHLVGTLVTAALLGAASAELGFTETDAAISVTDGDNVVLTYHKAEVPPPAGEDPAYRRSGFIHPLRTPAGGVVTGIHPKDHIHHLGLWHAWVKTKHDDREPDFWNLKKKTGLVRYAKTVARPMEKHGSVQFMVLQEHVSMDEGKDPVVVLEEQLIIGVTKSGGACLIDYETRQKNTSDKDITFPAYRYGGPIAYRGPNHWDKDNSKVLTSEGKTREDGHTTRGRWCAFEGPTDKGKATVAILCHPNNHDAPQRMRIWPPDSHNGAVFFNFVPIQEKPWMIGSDTIFRSRYRLVLSDGALDPKKINAAWDSYAERK